MKTMINSIHPNDIIIGERQRETFDEAALSELERSITKHGLFQAPGLASTKDPSIVYGHRRVIALTRILGRGDSFTYNGKEYSDCIPFVGVGELTPIQLKEIELAENLDRRDLTWQEQAKAVAELEALRNAQREEEAESSPEPIPPKPMTLIELAEETKKAPATCARALEVAKHLDDPEVAKAKNQKDALKIIERKAKQQHAEEKAKEFNPDASRHTLRFGDCREVIRTLPANKFAAVVTDPPYGIDMHKDQSWDGTWHEYDDTEAYCFNLITNLLPEWDRVTEEGAHLYIFCDLSKFEAIRQIVEGHGVFIPMPYPFIWNKGNVASYPRPDHWPRKSYEAVLYAVKGDKPHNKLDLAVIDTPQKQHHDHPAGKPWELYAHLIKRSCLAGDEVLDCFAGQGTIFKAAKDSNVVATGIELSEKYGILAKNTLKDLGE